MWPIGHSRGLLSVVRRLGIRSARPDLGSMYLSLTSLGLAAGVMASILTATWMVLIKPLSMPEPERLAFVKGLALDMANDPVAWWSEMRSVESLATFATGRVAAEDRDQSARVSAAAVSPGFFRVLDVQPVRGRAFAPLDETSAPRAAILSYGLWNSRFRTITLNGDAANGDAAVRLNGVTYSVIGVMPKSFSFPGTTQLWVLRGAENELAIDGTGGGSVSTWKASGWIARIRRGASRAQLAAEAAARIRYMNGNWTPRTHTHYGEPLVSVQALTAFAGGDARPLLSGLLTAATLLVIVVITNSSALFLSNLVRRQKDCAIRVTLGASPLRVVGEVLSEALALAWRSAALGAVVAYIFTTLLRRSVLQDYASQLADGMRINLWLLACCFGISVFAALMTGLVPAIVLARQDPNQVLQGRAGIGSAWRRRAVRRIVTVAEVAIAGGALAIAGLALKGAFALAGAAPGFSASNVFTSQCDFAKAPQKEDTITERQLQVLTELASLRQVGAAAMTNSLPIADATEGKLYLWKDNYSTSAAYFVASSGYFEALRIPIFSGRTFGSGDRSVIIVSRRLAERLWQEKNPIGASVRIDGEAKPRQVVGVVGDVKTRALSEEPEPQMYFPIGDPYRSHPLTKARLVLQCARECSSAPLERAARAALGSTPAYDWAPYRDLVYAATRQARLHATLFGALAVCIWIIASTGLFALVSYTTSCRLFEMGLCATMGAGPIDIVSMLSGEALGCTLIGALAGSVLAALLAKLTGAVVTGVGSFDPGTYAIATCVLLIGALLGSLLPTLRAASMDPGQALRTRLQ